MSNIWSLSRTKDRHPIDGDIRESPEMGSEAFLAGHDNRGLNLAVGSDHFMWPVSLRKAFKRNGESSISVFEPVLDSVFL